MANCAFVLLIGAILVQCSHQILHGRDAEAGEMPFYAAIHHKDESGTSSYACGGTLISDQLVLTAWFCVRDNKQKPLSHNRITVWLGIINLEMPDQYLQTHDVKQIHENYNNTKTIALLELGSTIQFTKYVQPASLSELGSLTGQLGTVAGFGVSETNKVSPTLKIVDLPVVHPFICGRSDLITIDRVWDLGMICVGYKNGTGICLGDAGGGLMFRRGSKWFVGAIAGFGTASIDDGYNCLESYAVFFETREFLPWIRQITNKDAVSKIESECGVPKNKIEDFIVNGEDADSKDWPWHAAIFHKKDMLSPLQYACGGSLIHIQYAITADHCTVDPKRRTNLSGKAIIVKFGIDEIHGWTKGTQQFPVFKIHRVRDRSYGGLKNDLALLEFRSEVEITDFVRPVCLPSRDIMPEEQGTVVGFGLTEESELSPNLKMASMPVIRDLQCTKSDEAWGSGLDIGLFCAGLANGTTVCKGDSGGGLVFPRNGIWEIGGLVSAGLSNGSVCRQDAFGAFTRVHHYLPWINDILGI